ncbi:hypothetical protein EOPP23_00105 [Endozoicomonas sp. OPT23]|uniref:SdiA-regulated domain-containing protein n=1 Tax=Endozoicomonas sp. OPT23 TaxID=2072845 RepID=UPI00129BD35C|nr:SdiA-regulated domain-containing protein [Endozoicomonas sp. OPT23]MRI31390.1 hypothetical protein [Endozoicomonas sp. OPT23]
MKALLKKVFQLFVLALMLFCTIWFTPVDEYLHREYLNFTVTDQELESSINLNQYKLAAGPIILDQAGDQVSGMTWSPITETLFVASRDDTVEILEYDKQGDLIRKIPANMGMDIEGIVWAGDYSFAFINERANSILVADINPDTHTIDLQNASTFTLDIAKGGNKGLEGISWSPITNEFYVVKERDPKAIYMIPDFRKNNKVVAKELTTFDGLMWNKRDFSGLLYDPRTNHFLVLSDESNVLAEVSSEGKQISTLELLSGWHGLESTIDQAEGITMDAEGTIFITSEPNHLYIFKKEK